MPLYGQALAGSSKPAGDPAIVMGGLVLIALIAIASLGVLFRWNVINRLLVGACAVCRPYRVSPAEPARVIVK